LQPVNFAGLRCFRRAALLAPDLHVKTQSKHLKLLKIGCLCGFSVAP
jgi:hypothetical protein